MQIIDMALFFRSLKGRSDFGIYWRRLLPNFSPIGEVPAEKTVIEQKKEKTKKQ